MNKKKKGKDMLVVKDNALMNASYNLDLVEQRLILLAIIEARESGKGINEKDALCVHASSYTQNFGGEKQAAYKALKVACDDLFQRQFSYHSTNENGNRQLHRSRWVSEIIYVENEATVKLIFAPAVVPLITRLEKHFSSYELEQVGNLNSKYAMRLYELLIAWKSTGKTPMIQLEEFRHQLGLGSTEYATMCNFKKYVLDLAIKQINEHTDITVTYEQHKKGVRVAGFSFRFKMKENVVKPNIGRDEHTGDLFVKLSDAQRHLFGAKLAQDARVQSEYAQKLPSDTYEAFGGALAEMLLEEKHFRSFFPLLVEHGYQAPKQK